MIFFIIENVYPIRHYVTREVEEVSSIKLRHKHMNMIRRNWIILRAFVPFVPVNENTVTDSEPVTEFRAARLRKNVYIPSSPKCTHIFSC
jgi:hypothetical protein